MKVALVASPAIQNKVRGSGVYERKLLEYLRKIPTLEIVEIPFNFWRFDYSEFDLVHFLYFDPFFLTFPPIRNRKTVLTLMDLTQILFPSQFPRGLKGELKWLFQKNSLRSVDHFMTLSNASKNDIAKTIGINESKITVSYLAGDEFKKITDQKTLQKTSNKYNLKKHFILFVGDVNPNKNLIGLLEALSMIAKNNRPQLVLAGKSFLNEKLTEAKVISKKIDELGIASDVVRPGFVDDAELANLYSLADAYVQPSIYEGFGFPIVQAMSCECPVICGTNSSLPEVGGNAAIYCDVENSFDLAEKIQSVLSLSKLEREKLIAKSLLQSKKFSWKKTAEVTFEAYKKLL